MYNFGHLSTYADQAIIYNHALLSYWDQPEAWLAMLDADEYLATPFPTNVTELWAGCFKGYGTVELARTAVRGKRTSRSGGQDRARKSLSHQWNTQFSASLYTELFHTLALRSCGDLDAPQ
ncbi:hypothetical protein WJX84_006326 [Apatococcus fuscideae]|uniref:Glycosyltransferase family 92 protein n=1 Tax=Apatococcus fuscideae TaxID=2026836 RepID=A0AAW1SI55_9CHLO